MSGSVEAVPRSAGCNRAVGPQRVDRAWKKISPPKSLISF